MKYLRHESWKEWELSCCYYCSYLTENQSNAGPAQAAKLVKNKKFV